MSEGVGCVSGTPVGAGWVGGWVGGSSLWGDKINATAQSRMYLKMSHGVSLLGLDSGRRHDPELAWVVDWLMCTCNCI